MKKHYFITALLASAFMAQVSAEPMKRVASMTGSPELPARIVIKQKDSVYAQSQSVTAFGQIVDKNAGYISLEVPANEAQSILSQLKQRPDIESAEMDYVVSVPQPTTQSQSLSDGVMSYSTSTFPPNDTNYGSQYYWRAQEDDAGASSIEVARSLSEQKQKMVVAVLDGGFVNPTDMDYAGGYNFSTLGGSRNGDYLKDTNDCSNPHGTAVAGIIGAYTDNGYHMAGIVDADIYAGRVLACSSGYLSDAAVGIRWAAKDPNVEGTPLPRRADVINLSLSGETTTCPTYMQSAIDYAVSKGSVVVVAAGNDSVDASKYSPANCNNVVTVAAVSMSGTKAYFTNRGNNIDVSAMGMGVLTLSGPDDVSFWNGTSFSSPLTAGVVALLKQNYPDLSPAQVESMLKTSAGNFSSNYADMGSGVVNAERLMNLAHDTYGSRSASIRHVMKEGERCQEDFYRSVLGGTPERIGKLCKLFEVDASKFYAANGKSYVAFSVPTGESLTVSNPNAQVSAVSTDPKFLLKDVDATGKRYGLQLCDANGSNCESDALYDLKIQNAVAPEFCEL